MPEGKPAGVACVHLDDAMRCKLFGDSRRPDLCRKFEAEAAVCGSNRQQALEGLQRLEVQSRP
jgi:hypothetical protein